MKTKKMHQTAQLVVVVIIATCLLAGCSSSKSARGDSKKGTTLRYSFPENQTLKYKTGADIKQELDIFGQEMIIDIGQYIGYSTTLKTKSKDQNQINVHIDSMDLSISSPQGDINPDMTFVYVSGEGTDSTEKGRMMWARVKGKTENDLLNLGFKQAFMFRPGAIIPLRGIKSRTKSYQFMYDYFMWLVKGIKAISPNSVVNTTQIGLAMINAMLKGYSKKVLKPKDIIILAK